MSTEYYKKKTKKGFKKRPMKGIKIFQKKIKTKSENMIVNDIEIFLKMKHKGWLKIEKFILNTKNKD